MLLNYTPLICFPKLEYSHHLRQAQTNSYMNYLTLLITAHFESSAHAILP